MIAGERDSGEAGFAHRRGDIRFGEDRVTRLGCAHAFVREAGFELAESKVGGGEQVARARETFARVFAVRCNIADGDKCGFAHGITRISTRRREASARPFAPGASTGWAPDFHAVSIVLGSTPRRTRASVTD